MTLPPTALLVAPTPHVAAVTYAQLTGAGFYVTLVTTFAEARERLETLPAVLVSEIRLGAFNGLHLALRAFNHGVRAIVLGCEDLVLQREAEKLGAAYVGATDRDRLSQELLACGTPVETGHSARRPVMGLLPPSPPRAAAPASVH